MCYHDIPEHLNPFDYETFDKNPSKGYAVVTNIETGLAEYLPMKNMTCADDGQPLGDALYDSKQNRL